MASGHGRSYDDYRIIPREGGKPVRHARATTIAGVLDERDALERWAIRMTAVGIVKRPDLFNLIAVTPLDKKRELDNICADAKEAAAASSGANMGNALHALTERVDAGESVIVPPSLQRDVDAYRAELDRCGIEILPQYIERVCVNAKLDEPIAGTTDRIVRWQGAQVVLDVKSAASMDFAWRKTAIQLSIYARADSLYDRDAGTHEDMPSVRQDVGIVMHLPAGKGVCTAYAVDLLAGWDAAAQSVAVRQWRKRRDLASPLVAVTELAA
jgi:hypothetical protein